MKHIHMELASGAQSKREMSQEREELQASSCNTFHDVSPPELGQVGDLGLGEEK